jgi:superfamily II DNA or RNA helicase
MIKTKNTVGEEALSTLNNYERAGVGISMGVGKTLIALKHFLKIYNYLNEIPTFETSKHNVKALVVAPKKSIFKSWTDDAKKFNLEYLLDHITFSTYRSLVKQDLDYDVVYLDECHSLLQNHNPWLKSFDGKIVGLTGTPPKNKYTEKGKMVDKYCPIVYSYITDEAVNDKILNDYKVIVHLLELDGNNTMKKTSKNRSWYTSEIKSYDYWSNRYNQSETGKQRQISSVMRMKDMQAFPSKAVYAKKLLNESNEKCILFANFQEQADNLCSHSYHSSNPESELNLNNFKEGKINKLSCVLQLSEGVNIPGLKEGIIMHAYGNNRKSSQRIGRLLRLNPDDKAIIHILCYKNTIDVKWVKDALDGFEESKISWYDPDEF